MLSSSSSNLPNKISTMIVGLIVIAFIVFFNAINHPFVHDDVVFILQNPHIGDLKNLSHVFLQSSSQADNVGINSYYRPILEIFYRLEYWAFGFNPAGYHFINVLIHIFNGLLIFGLLIRLKFSRWFSFGISALFLIHPVQTEAVACVSGISNLLSTFFVLIVLYNYVRERYIMALIFLGVALFTKEQVIIISLLLISLDIYQRKTGKWKMWILFILFTMSFMGLRNQITGAHMVQDILQSPGELWLRLLAIPRTILMYIRLILCPWDLHYYRNTDILQPNGTGFAVLAGILALGLWSMQKFQRHNREIILALVWFLVALLPVLNIVPLVNEYSFILTAEHFLYLPMVGILIVIATVFKEVYPSQRLKVVLGAVIIILGLTSMYQNTFWRGEIPLFQRMVAYEPRFARGHLLLANAYMANNQREKALFHYESALDIMKAYQSKSVNPQATRFYTDFINRINASIVQCLEPTANPQMSQIFFTTK